METNTSSIISQLGAGSGIDMAQLATNLAQAQFELRSQALSQRSEKLGRQISTASTLRNMLSQLSSALGGRVREGDLSSQPRLSDPSLANVTLEPGVKPPVSYQLEVRSLAAAQTLAATPIGGTEAVGSGTLTFRFGTTTTTRFTPDANHSSVDIAVASGDTIYDIAASINAANFGIEAYVADTLYGERLITKGQTGTKNGFIIEATENPDDLGLARIGWDPALNSPARMTSQSADARIAFDGMSFQSHSNTFKNIAPGLTVEALKANSGQTENITFSNPAGSISSAMEDLVSALNEVARELVTATAAQTGDLAGDSGARALQRSFQQLGTEVVMPNVPAGGTRTLGDLGLKLGRDGTFSLDTERLNRTLANDPDGAAAMFTTGIYGVYSTFDKLSRNASLSTNPGSLGGSVARYERLQTAINERSSALADQQETLRSRLFTNLARADIRVNTSQATLSFLQNQIDAWNSGGN